MCITAGTSTDTGDTDLSHGSPALLGSLEGGFDFKPLRYLGVGPYAQLMGGPFIVTDSGIHGWLTLGVRFRVTVRDERTQRLLGHRIDGVG